MYLVLNCCLQYVAVCEEVSIFNAVLELMLEVKSLLLLTTLLDAAVYHIQIFTHRGNKQKIWQSEIIMSAE